MRKFSKYQIVIGLSYLFGSINCIVADISSKFSSALNDPPIIILGIIMLLMTPIAVTDPRKEMVGKKASIFSIATHFLLNLLIIIYFNSFWWVVFLAIPQSILLIILLKK